MIFPAIVEPGADGLRLNIHGPIKVEVDEEFQSELRRLGARAIVEVEIRRKQPRRRNTTPQQGYYFAVIVKAIAEETGTDEETVNEYLKRFRPLKQSPFDGEPVPKRLKEMTTTETEDFHEHCRSWAASFLGLSIPLPNQVEV